MAHTKVEQAEVRAPGDWFGTFATFSSNWLGSKWGFAAAGLFILGWAVTGPVFRYSDTWQLVINTGTNIITFIMVFLIQNTQNRDARAINLKLDELIRALEGGDNQMIDIENLSDLQLDDLQVRYEAIKKACETREAQAKSRAKKPAGK